jgi:hypothetical protein
MAEKLSGAARPVLPPRRRQSRIVYGVADLRAVRE